MVKIFCNYCEKEIKEGDELIGVGTDCFFYVGREERRELSVYDSIACKSCKEDIEKDIIRTIAAHEN